MESTREENFRDGKVLIINDPFHEFDNKTLSQYKYYRFDQLFSNKKTVEAFEKLDQKLQKQGLLKLEIFEGRKRLARKHSPPRKQVRSPSPPPRKQVRSPSPPPRKHSPQKQIVPPRKPLEFRRAPPKDKTLGTPFISNDDYKKLENFMKSGSTVEIEARFGTFGERSNFNSSVPPQTFNRLKNTLLQMSVQNNGSLVVKEIDEKVTFVTKDYNDYQKITDLQDGNISYRRKDRKGVINVPVWGYRIGKSYEESVREKDVPQSIIFDDNNYRIKRRISFTDRDEEGPLYGVSVDLTVVENNNFKGSFTTYEVEIERIHGAISTAEFVNRIKFVYFIYQGYDRVFSNITKDTVRDNFNLVMTQAEKDNATRKFNNMLEAKPKSGLAIFRNKPKNVKIANLLEIDEKPYYAVTSKLDGVRTFLFIDHDALYFANPVNDIIKIAKGAQTMSGTIIDGELVGSNLFAFDIVKQTSSKIEQKELPARLNTLQDIGEKINVSSNIPFLKIIVKTFHMSTKETPFYENVKKAFNDNEKYEKQGLRTDGIILQPVKRPYQNNETYKWKPVEELTIDFEVIKVQEDRYNLVSFSKGKPITTSSKEYSKSEYVAFRGSKQNPYFKSVKFPKNQFNGEDVDKRIIEFKWNREEENFEPVRFRDDRPIPNELNIAIDVWTDIMNPIYETTIKGEDLVVMRRCHNMIKERMLKEFAAGGSLLDIGSGRGGDLAKWKKLNIGEVYIVEPDKEVIEEIKRRNNNINADIEIINKGFEDVREEIPRQVDNIAAFFSLTFFGKDEQMFENLINNINQNLKPGGYLIGIVLDGEKVHKLVSEKEYDTDAFSFKRKSKWSRSNKFGNKLETTINDPTSMVKGVEEYLFPFEEFRDRLKAVGINVYEPSKYGESFLDKNIKSLPKAAQIFSGLNRMFVFKKGEKTKTQLSASFKLQPAIHDNSSLIHAIVQTFSAKYNSMDRKEKEKYIDTVRSKLGFNITQEEFNKLGGGTMASELTKRYQRFAKDKSQAQKVSMDKFSLLLTSSEWLPDNLEIIQYISDKLGLDIYLFSQGIPYIPDAERKLSFTERCDMLYKGRKSIVITTDGVIFDSYSVGEKSIFSPTSTIITRIKKSLCVKPRAVKEQPKETKFKYWDKVFVIKGELKNIRGMVVSSDDNNVTIVTDHKDVSADMLEFPTDYIKKIE